MLSRHAKKVGTSAKNHRRINTELEDQFPFRPERQDLKKPEKAITRPKFMDVYSKISVKDNSVGKKLNLRVAAQKPLINDKYTRTEPDERKPMGSTMRPRFEGKYELHGVTGKGTFGVVYVGLDHQTGKKVAIKKVLQDRKYKNREHQILRSIKHDCLIEMKTSTLTYEGEQEYLNIIMDYYPEDLFKVVKRKELSPLQIKLFAYQIFKGLNYLAMMSIAHRDIKPQNILVDRISNKAVICDFGSAKVLIKGNSALDSDEPNLAYICSRCYRAPQLIFGATDYTTQIDMWSVGCVLVEMVNGRPPFMGESQVHQMLEIIKILGTPSRHEVQDMNHQYDMDEYSKIPAIKPMPWKNLLRTQEPQLIDLIAKTLAYSPRQRLTPAEALCHQYFNALRNEHQLAEIQSILGGIPDLLNFSEQQLKHCGQLASLIVPLWAQKRNFSNKAYPVTVNTRTAVKRALISTKLI